MAYASQSGRAQTNPSNPRAFGVCDRCGIWYNHDNLNWQFDWAGASLINKRILVCNTCNDIPQEQLRTIIIPADPLPVSNPRTENFSTDETNTRATSGTQLIPVSATGNGYTATLTLNVPSTFPTIAVGSTVVISGMSPPGYNKTAIVTASTNTTISYASTVLGPMTIAGTVLINVDPTTGLPLVDGDTRITQDYKVRVTQQTGEPPGGLNTQPGTDPNAPGDSDPGLPYNMTEVPKTGPL